INHI
ncbi:putative membrane protein, partial [Chlamydia psittaci 09DC77]